MLDETRRPPVTSRRLRQLLCRLLTAALVAAGLMVVHVPASQAAESVSLLPVRQVGQSGHAGLYGWGVAFDPTDDTILVGDYWNFRVARLNLDGTPAGPDPVTTANKGSANNESPDPLLHQSPYGLAVDPADGSFYFGDVDGGKTVDKYAHAGGEATLAFGGNGTGVGKFQYPSRVAVSPLDRKVFVVDQWQHLISVHDRTTGAELYSFGGNGAGNGQFKQPRGAAFDDAGRLFVADNYNSRIQVFVHDPADPVTPYKFSYSFGSRGTGPGQYSGTADMRGVAIDKVNGWVYVADAASGYVNKYALDGTYLTRFGGYGGGPDSFVGGPREVAVDSDGNVWVGDMPGFRVAKFDPDGNFLLESPSPAGTPPDGGFSQPRGVAADSTGQLFVTDTHNFRMQKFAPDGSFVAAWGHRGGGANGFNYHRGVAVDRRNDDVLVADTDNHMIARFSNDGTFEWEVGGFGTALNKLKNPHSLAVGADGTIYVADTQNQRVVAMDENGTPLFSFGQKGNLDGQFQFNRSVTVDPVDGTLWVSDSIRGNVQHFSAAGSFLGKFGSAGVGDGKLQRAADVEIMGDYVVVADVDAHQLKIWRKDGTFVKSVGGGGTALGEMFNPHGMDVAPDGTLYLVEQTGERVQQFQLVVGAPDSVAPQVSVTGPASGSTSQSPVTFTGTATDDVGVAYAEVAVKNPSGQWLRTDGTWGGFQWNPVSVDPSGSASTTWSYPFAAPADGNYGFQVRSTDTANNKSSSVWWPFTVSSQPPDTVAPTVAVSEPASGASVSSPVTFTGDAGDDVGVERIEVAVKDVGTGNWLRSDGTWGGFQWVAQPVADPGGTSTAWSYVFTAPADGSYGFQVRSADAGGNASPSIWRPFTVTSGPIDTQPPTVEYSSPASGASVNSPVDITGTGADDLAVASAEIAVKNVTTGAWLHSDGSWGPFAWVPFAVQSPGSTSTPWSFLFTAPGEGAYGFQTRMVDGAGNTSNAPWRTFNVIPTSSDTTPPTVTPTSPAANSTVPGPQVTLAGSAADDTGVAGVEVAVKRAGTSLWLQPDGSWGDYVWLPASLTGGGTPEATYSFTFTANPGGYGFFSRSTDTSGLISTRPFRSFTVS